MCKTTIAHPFQLTQQNRLWLRFYHVRRQCIETIKIAKTLVIEKCYCGGNIENSNILTSFPEFLSVTWTFGNEFEYPTWLIHFTIFLASFNALWRKIPQFLTYGPKVLVTVKIDIQRSIINSLIERTLAPVFRATPKVHLIRKQLHSWIEITPYSLIINMSSSLSVHKKIYLNVSTKQYISSNYEFSFQHFQKKIGLFFEFGFCAAAIWNFSVLKNVSDENTSIR